MKYVLCLNGPPRCGKDTAAGFLKVWPGCQVMRFSDPLKRAVPALFGRTHEELEPGKDSEELAYGMTYRQWQISMSEDWIKPHFGRGFFGSVLAERVKRSEAPLVVAPDCGFAPELAALVEELGSEVRVGLMRITRPGTSFAGDSRGPVDPPRGCRNLGEVRNGGSFYSFCALVRPIVVQWMNLPLSEELNS